MSKFWKFINQSDEEAELLLYGPISEQTWWGDEVTPKQFAEDLKALGEKEKITVRINSGGGDVFAANAIYSLLKDNSADIIVKIDGLAASAATIVAMAGDEIQIPSNGMMMIHDPAVVLIGYYNTEDFAELTEVLEKVKETIIIAYEKKTGKDRDEISRLMKEETWMTGQEAVDLGFADTLLDEEVESILNGKMLIVNDISHDISKYSKIPKNITAAKPSNFIRNQVIKPISFKDNTKIQKEGEKRMNEIKTVEDLEKAYPDLVNELISEAKKKGAEEERSRIKDIEDIQNNIDPGLVYKAKYEKPMDAKELAFEALKLDSVKGQKYLNDIKKDLDDSGVRDIKPSSTDVPAEEKPKTVADKFKKVAAILDAKRRGVNING